ncbi:MAG: hypothetical protein Q7J03_00640 [Methanoregula sp.]|nr:hypothetical protein [Methanoregula sp.]
MDVLTTSGISIADPLVLIMTICAGASVGMILSLLQISIPAGLMPFLFIVVSSLMVFLEGSWLYFWYKPHLNRAI